MCSFWPSGDDSDLPTGGQGECFPLFPSAHLEPVGSRSSLPALRNLIGSIKYKQMGCFLYEHMMFLGFDVSD